VSDTIFALFDRPDDAGRAALRVEELGTVDQHCTVKIHQHRVDTQQLPVEATRTINGALLGVVLGIILGPLLGWLVAGPLHVIPAAPAAGAIMGGVGGALIGALGGGLMGASDPQRQVSQFSRRVERGKTLVTIEAPTSELRERAERICRDFGAVIDAGQWSASPASSTT
jgi:hypothetical protein